MVSLLYIKSSSYSLSDLTRVCIFTFESQQLVTTPKNACTAVGTLQSINIPKTIDFDQVKKGLPYVFILNSDTYPDTLSIFNDSFDNKFKEISQNITDNKIDILIFDFFDQRQVFFIF